MPRITTEAEQAQSKLFQSLGQYFANQGTTLRQVAGAITISRMTPLQLEDFGAWLKEAGVIAIDAKTLSGSQLFLLRSSEMLGQNNTLLDGPKSFPAASWADKGKEKLIIPLEGQKIEKVRAMSEALDAEGPIFTSSRLVPEGPATLDVILHEINQELAKIDSPEDRAVMLADSLRDARSVSWDAQVLPGDPEARAAANTVISRAFERYLHPASKHPAHHDRIREKELSVALTQLMDGIEGLEPETKREFRNAAEKDIGSWARERPFRISMRELDRTHDHADALRENKKRSDNDIVNFTRDRLADVPEEQRLYVLTDALVHAASIGGKIKDQLSSMNAPVNPDVKLTTALSAYAAEALTPNEQAQQLYSVASACKDLVDTLPLRLELVQAQKALRKEEEIAKSDPTAVTESPTTALALSTPRTKALVHIPRNR